MRDWRLPQRSAVRFGGFGNRRLRGCRSSVALLRGTWRSFGLHPLHGQSAQGRCESQAGAMPCLLVPNRPLRICSQGRGIHSHWAVAASFVFEQLANRFDAHHGEAAKHCWGGPAGVGARKPVRLTCAAMGGKAVCEDKPSPTADVLTAWWARVLTRSKAVSRCG